MYSWLLQLFLLFRFSVKEKTNLIVKFLEI